MVLASTAGFLRLRSKDSSSALLLGRLLPLLWLMFQFLRGNQSKGTEALRQMTHQLSRLLRHTLRTAQTWSRRKHRNLFINNLATFIIFNRAVIEISLKQRKLN